MSTLQLRSKWTMERRKFKTNYVSISKDTAQNSRPMEQILEINKIDTSLIFVQPITNFFLLVNAENDVVFQQGTKKDRSTCIEILRV